MSARQISTSIGRRAAPTLGALLLVACATHLPPAVRQPPSAPPPAAVGTSPAAPGALPPAKPDQIPLHGGGYYADDGPVFDVPYDLDALPEPVPRDEPPNRLANKPYVVFGHTYTPLAPHAPYVEQGVASWYGRKFNGKRTSSGEQYDMFKLTAAHPTLPIPSYARVTNLDNGKSIVVRINDRGPFRKNRVMDMSYAAAYRLGYHNKGSARVRVEALDPDAPAVASLPASLPAPPGAPAQPPIDTSLVGDPLMALAHDAPDTNSAVAPSAAQPTGSLAPGVWLQIAAFASQSAAESFRARLAAEWDDSHAQPAVLAAGRVWRVRIGPYASDSEAKAAALRVAAAYAVQPLLVQ